MNTGPADVRPQPLSGQLRGNSRNVEDFTGTTGESLWYESAKLLFEADCYCRWYFPSRIFKSLQITMEIIRDVINWIDSDSFGGGESKTWWRHQMETFSALLALCAGNSPVTGEFPAQRPVTRSFDISLICAWINGWVNNREAGDFRRHRAHYDVVVMI